MSDSERGTIAEWLRIGGFVGVAILGALGIIKLGPQAIGDLLDLLPAIATLTGTQAGAALVGMVGLAVALLRRLS